MPSPIILDPTDHARLATIAEAARIMGVSKRTIYLWIQAGKVESRRTASGQQRVVVGQLMRRAQGA